jgi:hypothetical protein
LLGRRDLLIGSTLGLMSLPGVGRAAGPTPPELIEVARSPHFIWNAVALTRNGRIFVGMPRWPGFNGTPSVAEVMPDGSLVPYPGGEWNTWSPGRSVENAFVCVNTIPTAALVQFLAQHEREERTEHMTAYCGEAVPFYPNCGSRLVTLASGEDGQKRALKPLISVNP